MLPYRFLILSFLSLSFLACKKDKPTEIADLVFPSDTYYVSNGSELQLDVQQGNKKYQLTVDDGTMIQAQADGSILPAGRLILKGMKKGNTVLHVKDEVSGKEVSLKIVVVDPFRLLKMSSPVPAIKVAPQVSQETRNTIREEAKAFADFELESILILHRNAEQRFFVFEKGKELIKSNVKQSGTYELVFDAEGEQRLTLHFDGANTPLTLGVRANSSWATHQLREFAGSNPADQIAAKRMGTIRAEVPAEYFDRFFITYKDLTQHFLEAYQDVELVELYQQIEIWSDFQNYGLKIGDGLLD